ncbi:MAG: hypothetical protein JSR82_00275 [Verrucomicrobia bacterium]|nr:hypothetical protein [Verrucomicrobiota bacterium]
MHFACRLLLATLLTGIAWAGNDVRLTDGTVFKNARIQKIEGATVFVTHQGGEARIELRRFEPELQRELVKASLAAISESSSVAAKSVAKPTEEGVVVTAPSIPLVEPFALTPEDARARRFFDDIAKKKKAQDAKKEPTIWNVKAWRYLPPLINVSAEDPNKPSILKWDLQTSSANTYGAPDPRTGK